MIARRGRCRPVVRLAAVPLALALLAGCSDAATDGTAYGESAAAEQDVALDEAGQNYDAEVAQEEVEEEAQYDYDAEYGVGFDDGAVDGLEAGADLGHQAGYSDAENGDERGTYADSAPPAYDVRYSPQYDSEGYADGYEAGFAEGYVPAYESAYEEGYDEALAYYSDYETENPYDEDCGDFEGPVIVSEDDPDNVNYDGDGVGCE